MRLWNYIKSLNKTFLTTIVLVVVAIPLTILLPQRNGATEFKCPNQYQNSKEYAEDLAQWILGEKDKNPDITVDELFTLRNKELEENNCGPYPWPIIEDDVWSDTAVSWSNDISIAGTKYELVDFSQNGDIELATYNSQGTSPDRFDQEIHIFYVPPNSISAGTADEIVPIQKVANNFAYHIEKGGLTLLNSFSFPDPDNPGRDIYVLISYKLNSSENYGTIMFVITRQFDVGIFAVVYSKTIENDKEPSLLEDRILEWLTTHTEYLEGLEEFNASDFLADNYPVAILTASHKTASSLSAYIKMRN